MFYTYFLSTFGYDVWEKKEKTNVSRTTLDDWMALGGKAKHGRD